MDDLHHHSSSTESDIKEQSSPNTKAAQRLRRAAVSAYEYRSGREPDELLKMRHARPLSREGILADGQRRVV
jgi:hypothetical protein